MENFLKKYSIFFLVVILVLAVFFRLYELKTIPPGLYPDEAMNGTNALEANTTNEYKVFYPDNNGREGLFINIQAQAIKVFGNEPWALRIVSVFFGILTVLGTYLLTRKLFEMESIALFASFFLATSFWHINFSRIGFRAIMAPMFLVWGLYFLFVSLEKKNFLWPLIGGLLFGVGFHSYIAYRAMPIILLPAIFVLFKNRKFMTIILFVAGATIAISPLFFYFYHNPQDFFGRTSQISVFTSPTLVKDLIINTAKTVGMFFVAGDFNWRHNIAGAPQLWWPVAILFLIGIIISVKKNNFKTKKLLDTVFVAHP
jgi:4-amino-4-deoxy-L-arabinose transferase-like glycosyltransferase